MVFRKVVESRITEVSLMVVSPLLEWSALYFVYVVPFGFYIAL